MPGSGKQPALPLGGFHYSGVGNVYLTAFGFLWVDNAEQLAEKMNDCDFNSKGIGLDQITGIPVKSSKEMLSHLIHRFLRFSQMGGGVALTKTPRHGGGEKLNPCLRALAGNQAGGRLRGRLNSQPAGRDIPWEGLRANTATGSPKGEMSGSERVKPENFLLIKNS